MMTRSRSLLPSSEASESGSNAGPIEGEFLVSGSSTVYPIVLEQAEAFGAANTGVAISVEGPGSGDGAQKFRRRVPIANASRLYKGENLLHARPMGSSTSSCGERSTASRSSRRPRMIWSTVCRSTTSTLWSLGSQWLVVLGGRQCAHFAVGRTTFPDVPLEVYGPGESPGRSTRSARSSLSPSRRARPAWTPKLASS